MNLLIKKERLLTKLNTNRATHKELYEKAKVEYLKQAIEECESNLNKLNRGEFIKACSGLPIPLSYLSEYDKAIEMLELDEREELNLSESEFVKFIQDNWDWKRSFASNTGSYLAE